MIKVFFKFFKEYHKEYYNQTYMMDPNIIDFLIDCHN